MPPTIKDVARFARVSITSASYALNNTGTISEATRKRVLDAAEKLNYHPNAFARNLKKPKTRTIGVFISRFAGSFYEDILEGIHDAVLKTGYELLVCPETQTVHKILTHRQVDGAIIFDSKIQSDILIRLASKKFPIVVLDRQLQADYLISLLIDNQTGTREAFYHLYDQGARKIYFITGVMNSFDNLERMNTFYTEAGKNNLTVKCFEGDFTEISGYDIARTIIETNDLPEAVFCCNDQMAMGFIRAMKENNISVPEDIGIVGFDDIHFVKLMKPSLTTVAVSRFEWGSMAVTQLMDFLENEKPFQPIRIASRLVQRESSIRPYSGSVKMPSN
ncbi:MAG TPA: LacI family DNA-binding transcriptional regulator [Longilinea sp.]|nr:LacI family DNA-binding transcriptional regulator [Longilinea sp.]